ncbi:esterase/lipase family protein [Roseateles sp. So40a]|uniref:esterase/lipase family protein n=1 Tax=Roseateles sp. So40a TaxID=3400226 RepID=UPI003A8904AD
MNGWLQRLISSFRWVVGPLLALWVGTRWGVPVGLGVLALFVLGPALGMLPGFLILRFVPPAPGLSAAPLPDLIQAWWREVVAVTRVFSWQQPWAEHQEPDFLPEASPAAARRGVVFLHGYNCNRGLWNRWMKVLRARGTPFIALTQTPAFGSIDAYSPQIDAAVRKMQAHTGLAPLIVAHSMGGLSARAWWRSQGHPFDRIHRILTLGTPHHGTLMAKLGTTENARQMRGDSEWLNQLARDEPAHMAGHFDCLYGHCDQIVFPAETAVLPGARVLHLPARGHLQLLFEPQAMERALALLAEPAPEAQGVTRRP